MKERGIIMSGQNPKLILEDRKTQTRLIIVSQPIVCDTTSTPRAGVKSCKCPTYEENLGPCIQGWTGDLNSQGHCPYCDHSKECHEKVSCNYGVAGDRLWVREAARLVSEADGETRIQYRSGGDFRDLPEGVNSDTNAALFAWIDWQSHHERAWRPSIHIPKWASRITLEITKVRLERLQDISEEDASAEGMRIEDAERQAFFTPVGAYAHLWDSLHGKGAWKKNPWVWVIAFRKIKP